MENKTKNLYKIKGSDTFPVYGVIQYLVRTNKAIFESLEEKNNKNESIRIATNSTLLCISSAIITTGAIIGLEALIK